MLCVQAEGDITAIAKTLTPWLEPMLEQPDTLPPLAQALLDHIAISANRSALKAFHSCAYMSWLPSGHALCMQMPASLLKTLRDYMCWPANNIVDHIAVVFCLYPA